MSDCVGLVYVVCVLVRYRMSQIPRHTVMSAYARFVHIICLYCLLISDNTKNINIKPKWLLQVYLQWKEG